MNIDFSVHNVAQKFLTFPPEVDVTSEPDTVGEASGRLNIYHIPLDLEPAGVGALRPSRITRAGLLEW